MKKIIAFLAILLLVSCSPPYKKSFNSAVRINNGAGSGVLLQDGLHILTAAHVVDMNYNGHIDDRELDVEVTIGESSTIHSAILIRMGRWSGDSGFMPNNDLALIKLNSRVSGGSQLSLLYSDVGTEVYTIGCPMGSPLHISTGILSVSGNNGLRRTSCPVYYGNSGGGLFSSSGEIIGILSMMDVDNTRGFQAEPITTSSMFVETKDIIRFLGPEYFIQLDKEKEKRNNKILLFLFFSSLVSYAAFEWKLLLGKKVC